jgi:hypothetical protein
MLSRAAVTFLALAAAGKAAAPAGGAAAATAAVTAPAPAATELVADVAIWGATVCGVLGAVAAARMNATVALLQPDDHVGGMTTGGLSGMDLNMPVGGLFAEFMARAKIPAKPFPNFEPHVAAAALAALLAEAPRVTLVTGAGALTATAAAAAGSLTSFATAGGYNVTAAQFIDCSYEGDLVQAALPPGAWTVGREGAHVYNESAAGSEGAPWATNRFDAGVSPWLDAANTTLVPTVALAPAQKPGDGDGRVQSYNYRVCITDDAALRVHIDPPPGYTPAAMELMRRWWVAEAAAGRAANHTLDDLFQLRPLPCAACTSPGARKLDVNSGPAFGTDMPFLQYAYPTGNASVRADVAAAHQWWTRAIFTFLGTDASGAVPPALQRSVGSFGLCGDEWPATGHWPPQLYVREGVRMVGSPVWTEANVVGAATASSPTSVGLSRWLVDIHPVQRVAARDPATGDWFVANAGDVNTRHQTWQLSEVPWEVLLPPPCGAACPGNLAAPTAPSMSHVAYATYRLEPQFGVIGQAAAVGAVLALRAGGGVSLRDLDVPALQAELVAQGQLINATAPPPSPAVTLAPCDATDWRQNWTHVAADATLRVAGGAGDPAAVQWQLGEAAAGTPWHRLSRADRFLRHGGTIGGALSDGAGGVCASILDYSKAAGAPVWAALCHTGDKDPAHANQEWAVEQAAGAGGGWQLRSTLSGLCLGAAAADAGAALQQAPCGGSLTAWAAAPAAAPAGGPLQLLAPAADGGGPGPLCASAPGTAITVAPAAAAGAGAALRRRRA